MKIEQPNWTNIMGMTKPNSHYESRLRWWFEEHVEPINKMLAEGVEVAGDEVDKDTWIWGSHYMDDGCEKKALLINIQPIKKETAEEVLRDYIKWHTEKPDTIDITDELAKRAKAVLGAE